jgi:ferredoxin
LIVRVDASRCQGHGRCAVEAPGIYALDAEGHCAVDGRTVPPGLEDEARVGVEVCPERAISLEP